MKCIVCGSEIRDYYLKGSRKDMKVSFCFNHISDCMKCDSCSIGAENSENGR